MEVKVTMFNTELIRTYMEQSSILQKGIAYYKHIDSSLTDAMAKECAIREAQGYCQRRWQSDSSGYLNEYRAFEEFKERVNNGSYFNITRYDNAQSWSLMGWLKEKYLKQLRLALIFVPILLLLVLLSKLFS